MRREWRISSFNIYRSLQVYVVLGEKYSNYSHQYTNLDIAKNLDIIYHLIVSLDTDQICSICVRE